jgi:hypothetical protein
MRKARMMCSKFPTPMTSGDQLSLTHMSVDPTSMIIVRAGDRTGAHEAEGNHGAAWTDVVDHLRSGEATAWLSLRSKDGVHTRPVFAAWTGTSFVVASKTTAVKTRHLDSGDPCSLALDLSSTHLVVEAHPVRLTAQHDLKRASAAFLDVYDWPTTIAGDELDAPYSAPTSGGPPFRVYELAPTRAFAFPTADQFEPTRFTF